MPASSSARLRSATSLRNACSSGKPRVTTLPSTAIGRHATMSGLVGGLAPRPTIVGQPSRERGRRGRATGGRHRGRRPASSAAARRARGRRRGRGDGRRLGRGVGSARGRLGPASARLVARAAGVGGLAARPRSGRVGLRRPARWRRSGRVRCGRDAGLAELGVAGRRGRGAAAAAPGERRRRPARGAGRRRRARARAGGAGRRRRRGPGRSPRAGARRRSEPGVRSRVGAGPGPRRAGRGSRR